MQEVLRRLPFSFELFYIKFTKLGTTVEFLLTGKKVNETITEEEKQIIDAYRKAEPAEQNVIKKILNITTRQTKSSDLKIG